MKKVEIIDRNRNAIILLDVLKPEGVGHQISVRGTGFIISPEGKFITCAHVYKEIPEKDLEFLGARVSSKTDSRGITIYERYGVRLLKMDQENDIVLMEIINHNKIAFATIKDFGGSSALQEGDEVIFIGYPLATEFLGLQFGITMTSSSSIISSVKRRGVDGSLHFFMIDTHVNNGASGSPVFSVESGKVIGVISGRISTKISLPDGKMVDIPASMGICRPIQYVETLIKQTDI